MTLHSPQVSTTEVVSRCKITQKDFIELKDGVGRLNTIMNSAISELKSVSSTSRDNNKLLTAILEQGKKNAEKMDEINFHIKSIAGSFKIMFDLEKNRLHQQSAHQSEILALLKMKK